MESYEKGLNIKMQIFEWSDKLRLQEEVADLAIELIARYQPVASDLRFMNGNFLFINLIFLLQSSTGILCFTTCWYFQTIAAEESINPCISKCYHEQEKTLVQKRDLGQYFDNYAKELERLIVQ